VAKLRFDASQQFDDPREMPAYSIPQAARYLRVPVTTLRYWVLGQNYREDSGRKRAEPVIMLPENGNHLLSFFNLTEAHILRAIRKDYNIQLPQIRAAIDFLGEKFGTIHPLIQHSFKTDGARLFVNELGRLIDASGWGQLAMHDMMIHLERVEFKNQMAGRLYPFTRLRDPGPKSVFIDPRYSFGRPVLATIKIPTGVIADRYAAGETVQELASDYGCEGLDIEEAIRCELITDKAAA
jgi:uncharacterized protein (DUF433 family)